MTRLTVVLARTYVAEVVWICFCKMMETHWAIRHKRIYRKYISGRGTITFANSVDRITDSLVVQGI